MKMGSAADLLSVETSDDMEVVDFTIEGNALAFEILSAGVYSDRVTAIIRELSANAYDAHVEAGTLDKQFHIQLPNVLEPKFRIRDYGTGLAPSLVKKLYTRYFKSTKTKSNDTVGCMGLGSKTPFAYVDSFSVTTYWNGLKFVFDAFKNEKGLPAIALLNGDEFPNGEPTDEPNGLEVSFPVKGQDHYEFRTKAAEVLKFFKVKPKVTGVSNFEIETVDYLLENPNYSILASRGESVVVMGNIAYPFSTDEFVDTIDELTSKEKKLVDWGIHLFVPIGAVRIAANREKLTYTAETRATVKKILGEAVESIETDAKKRMEDAKSVWEARLLFGRVRKGVIGEVIGFDDASSIDWNGRTVSNVIHINDFDYEIRPKVEVVSVKEEEYNSYYGRRRRRRNTNNAVNSGGIRHWTVDQILVEDCPVIFVNDLNRGAYAAAKRYMEEQDIEEAYMIDKAEDEFVDAADCRHLLVLCSTLPKPERAPRGTRTSNGRTNRTLLRKYVGSTFIDEQVELDDGGVYIETRRDKVKWSYTFGSEGYDFRDISVMREVTQRLGTLDADDTIYGIRPCDMERLKKSDGEWITFEQFVADTVRQHAPAMLEKASLYLADIDTKFLSFDDDEIDLGQDSAIKEVVELTKKISDLRQDRELQAWLWLAEYTKLYSPKMDTTVREKYQKIYKTYPLLSSISYWGGEARKEIARYIRLIDMENECDAELAAEAA